MLLGHGAARLAHGIASRNSLQDAGQLEDAKGRAPAELGQRVVAGDGRVPLDDLLRLGHAGCSSGQKRGRLGLFYAGGLGHVGGLGEVELSEKVADVGERVTDGGHFPAASNSC